MQLADLFVSYKQVKTPKLDKQIIEEPPLNKFQRMLEFISNREDKKEQKKLDEEQLEMQENPTDFAKIKYIYNPNNYNTENTNYSQTNYSGYNEFKTRFNNYLNSRLDINDADKQTLKDILTPIAAMESGFNSKIGNKNSSALGYFQFVDGTRKNYSNYSREEFMNDPNKQFDAAINYFNDIKRMLKPYENKIKERDITPLQAVYGMWWRPASIINFLKTGEDNYVSQSDNLTLKDILNKAKKWNV